MEARREEFRKYLEETGVIGALSKALNKLYELKYDRSESAVKFIQDNLGTENSPSLAEYQMLVKELNDVKAALAMTQNQQVTRRSSKHTSISLSSKSATKVKSIEGSSHKLKSNETINTSDDATTLISELLNNTECQSLLKKHLKIKLFDKLKNEKTSFGTTLLDCINSGLQNPKSSVGIYAADAEAYGTFVELFSPIIEDYHVGFTSEMTHPESNWGDVEVFTNLDPENEFIVSTRIRCSRSVAGFPLNPLMTEQNYLDLMEKVKEVLVGLEDDLSGTLHVLDEMDTETKENLINEHLLFKDGDKYLEAAGATKFWPKGRAIFMNEPKTFSVWINEEDRLRFISMETGGNLGSVYSRLKNAVEKCSEKLNFSKHQRFGFLTFCPTNLGTTIRASVMIKVPKLAAQDSALQEMADKLNLQIRGTHGEHSEAVNGMYEISNKRRLGLTDFEAVKIMYDGILEIIEKEKSME